MVKKMSRNTEGTLWSQEKKLSETLGLGRCRGFQETAWSGETHPFQGEDGSGVNRHAMVQPTQVTDGVSVSRHVSRSRMGTEDSWCGILLRSLNPILQSLESHVNILSRKTDIRLQVLERSFATAWKQHQQLKRLERQEKGQALKSRHWQLNGIEGMDLLVALKV